MTNSRSAAQTSAPGDEKSTRMAVAAEIVDLAHAVRHVFNVRQFEQLKGAPHRLTRIEGRLFIQVARSPGATQAEIAARTGRDKGQLARLVSGLRDAGLVELHPDPLDRRSQRLFLSAAGERLERQIADERRRLSQIAIGSMTDHEARSLRSLLRQMKVDLDSAC